jgi:hypothetical protein
MIFLREFIDGVLLALIAARVGVIESLIFVVYRRYD